MILKSVLGDSKYSVPNICASTTTLLSSPISVLILIGSSLIPLPKIALGSFGSLLYCFSFGWEASSFFSCFSGIWTGGVASSSACICSYIFYSWRSSIFMFKL